MEGKKESVKERGIITYFNPQKNFGFLVSSENRDLFFHKDNCEDFIPVKGLVVLFEKGFDTCNREKAVRLQKSEKVYA